MPLMLRKLVLDGMRCRRCNRVLTDSKSIKKGIGPICLHKEHKESEKKQRINNLWDLVWGREMDAELIGEFIGE